MASIAAIKRGRIIAYNVVLTSVVMRLFYSGIRGQIECWLSVSFRKINSFDLMPTCTDYRQQLYDDDDGDVQIWFPD